jgi:hypothetical protein
MSLMDQDDGEDHMARMSKACLDVSSTEIKWHMNYIHTITTQLQRMEIDCHVSTSDSGADTCVFGDGSAVRTNKSKGRQNLVGFDSQSARKKDLDLVTADILTSTADRQPVILRRHYGVHNPGSSTTLIWDAHIRHAGAVADACPLDQLAHPDRRKGRQSMYLPKDSTSGDHWRRFSMAPREKHLLMAKRIVGYLKRFPAYRIVLNPNPLDATKITKNFQQHDNWTELYLETEEEIPQDKAEVLTSSKPVQITIFVDADHAHCEVTRRSATGILVFINSTPVWWYSKMQQTVERQVLMDRSSPIPSGSHRSRPCHRSGYTRR